MLKVRIHIVLIILALFLISLTFHDTPRTHAATFSDFPFSGYAEVAEGCRITLENCLQVRSGPGTYYRKVHRLRIGAVVRVDRIIWNDSRLWYRIKQDEWLRFPERVQSNWYIAAEFTRWLPPQQESVFESATATTTTTKRIDVDLTDQIIRAYDGDALFMGIPVSTGIEATRTPRGVFTIFKKTPSRYMQGPIEGISEQSFDLPGVPWNLYFTEQGATIHGTYWHNKFGEPQSNGCVNLPTEKAEKLYDWADLGTKVFVHD